MMALANALMITWAGNVQAQVYGAAGYFPLNSDLAPVVVETGYVSLSAITINGINQTGYTTVDGATGVITSGHATDTMPNVGKYFQFTLTTLVNNIQIQVGYRARRSINGPSNIDFTKADDGVNFTTVDSSAMLAAAVWQVHTFNFDASMGAGQTRTVRIHPYNATTLGGTLGLDSVFVNYMMHSVTVGVFLQGPFNAGGSIMNDGLRSAGLLPLTEPYTGLGYVHTGGGGGETAPASLFNSAGPDGPEDWVVVELRSFTSPSTVIASQSALVRRDGLVMNTSGNTLLRFRVPAQSFIAVAVRHRNHLGAMTNAGTFGVPIPSGSTVDFRLPATPVHSLFLGGVPRYIVNPGNAVLWAGNVVPDGSVKYTGTANDRDPILGAIGGVVPTNIVTGQYRVEDVNMDAIVKYTGPDNDRDIILQNIGGVVPTNTRVQHLP